MQLIIFKFKVVETGDGNVELKVQRFNKTLKKINITYNTVTLAGSVTDVGVSLNPASEGIDYEKTQGTLTFGIGQVYNFINT